MSKRSDRREADRIARKLAYQTQRQQPSEPAAVSDAQLAANRANSQLSTGPVTPEGRAKSSLNALKHGLSGKTVLLPHEDAAQYQRELDDCLEMYQPATEEELRLVQSINDCVWRIDRVQRLQLAVHYKGHLEFAEKYADLPAQERAHLIEADAYLKYEKQLRNLFLQESRIRRIQEKDHAELLRLQAIRKRQEQAAPPAPLPSPTPRPADAPVAAPAANGFEFSNVPATDDHYQQQAA
jgi:hypothetical protein